MATYCRWLCWYCSNATPVQYAIPGEPDLWQPTAAGCAGIAVMQHQCNMQYQVNPIYGDLLPLDVLVLQ